MFQLFPLIKLSSDLSAMGNNGKHSECRSFRPLVMAFIGMGAVWRAASDLQRTKQVTPLLAPGKGRRGGEGGGAAARGGGGGRE